MPARQKKARNWAYLALLLIAVGVIAGARLLVRQRIPISRITPTPASITALKITPPQNLIEPADQTAEIITTPAIPTPSPAIEKEGITVWIDEVRRPAVQAYIDAHPHKANLIQIVIADRGQFPDKVLQYNQKGSGMPDVVFAEPNLVLRVSDEAHHYPLDLTGWVPKTVIQNFVAGALDACTIDGKLYCLRYDLAQMVLYYNQPLMEEFGYEVPQTWEEYQALSDRVAAEHPGYILGSFGDGWGFRTYFTPSGCPFSEAIDANTVRINLDHPGCLRAANLVSHMLENGTLLPESPFSPRFIRAANDNKLLMMIAAAWFGEYMFGGKPGSPYYQTAEGQLGVALPLKWEGEDKIITDAMGGGAWTIYRDSPNPELAVDLVIWMTTSIEALQTGPDYPAYQPIARAWGDWVKQNPLYAFDPFPIWDQAAGMISSQNKEPRYDTYAILDNAVQQAIQGRKNLLEVLPEIQLALDKMAEGAGYQVIR